MTSVPENKFVLNDFALNIFSILANYTGITIWVIKENGEYVYSSPSLTKIIGNNRQSNLVDESSWRSCQEVMETREPQVIEEHYKGQWFLSIKTPLIENDQVIGVAGFAFDITDKKENEKLKLDSLAFEEREKTLRLIAASMAHELRTPLRGIDSNLSGIEIYLPILMEGYQIAKQAGLNVPKIDSQKYQFLEQAFQAAIKETKTAFNVVDMLLIKTDQLHVDSAQFNTFNIIACLNKALNNYHFENHERALVHVKEECHFDFYGDDFLMIHVFLNLIKNALYFIKAASKGHIEIWCEKLKETNMLYFKDTGTGIASNVLPHIFDMYYSQVKHGTGIGLAFCKLVMKKMGGDITCESKEGEYTCFTLTFPSVTQK